MVFYRFSIVVPQVFNRISTGFHRLFIDVIGVLLICQSFSDVLSQGARRKKKNDAAAFVVPPNAPPASRPRTARWWGRRSLGSQKKPPDIGEDIYSYGHLLVITGYKWDYAFYKWGYKYL